MKWLATVFSLILLPAPGLSQAKTQPADVSKEVEARTGHKINTAAKAAGWTLPESVSLDDGLTEDEAVAIALWNNPALQADYREPVRALGRRSKHPAWLVLEVSKTFYVQQSLRQNFVLATNNLAKLRRLT